MTLITDITHLKDIATKHAEFFIQLNFGARSSKTIYWNGKLFNIFNEIDDTYQELTEEQLMDSDFTNIGEALTQKALYKYE